jgi:hypothetical protein
MTLTSSKRESKVGDPWPHWSYMLSFSSIYTGLHALILLPKPHTLRMWVHTCLVMLSYAVMRVVQVFHHFWCWVWLVSLWEMVFHLLRCELTMVRIDVVFWAVVGMVEMVNTIMACGARIHQGPNLRGRHPRIIYAATCPVWNGFLTNYIGYRLCVKLSWVVLASYFVTCLNHMV